MEKSLEPLKGAYAPELCPTWERLEALFEIHENWNGYNVAAPNPDAIERANAWVQDLYADVKNQGLPWLSPHVAANEDGDVVFEWSRNRKRLAVYVTPTDATYIMAWGPSVQHEMTDGSALSAADRRHVWSWLTA